MLRKKNPHRRGEEGHWQVSYIDLLTAMLAAFTLLLAMSKPDQAKFDSFASASSAKNIQQNLSTVAKELIETINKDSTLRNQVKVVLTDDGVEVRFATGLLFALGKAKMQPDGYEAVKRLAPVLLKFVEARKAYISVEGHTDDQPINGGKEFRSNWELSSSRALDVVHYLQDSIGFVPHRLSGIGYADSRPQDTDRDSLTGKFTDFARAQNRRVVLRIYYFNGTTL
jgi:chemotaxis protein MotB